MSEAGFGGKPIWMVEGGLFLVAVVYDADHGEQSDCRYNTGNPIRNFHYVVSFLQFASLVGSQIPPLLIRGILGFHWVRELVLWS